MNCLAFEKLAEVFGIKDLTLTSSSPSSSKSSSSSAIASAANKAPAAPAASSAEKIAVPLPSASAPPIRAALTPLTIGNFCPLAIK